LGIVRDAYFYGKPVGAVNSGKAGISAAGVAPLDQPGVFVSSDAASAFIDTFEGGLKTFKFLNRFPVDA
jgi:catalase